VQLATSKLRESYFSQYVLQVRFMKPTLGDYIMPFPGSPGAFHSSLRSTPIFIFAPQRIPSTLSFWEENHKDKIRDIGRPRRPENPSVLLFRRSRDVVPTVKDLYIDQ